MDQEKVSAPSKEEKHSLLVVSVRLLHLIRQHKAGSPVFRRMAERIQARADARKA